MRRLHRHGRYGPRQTNSEQRALIQPLVLGVVVLATLFLAGRWVLNMFDVGNTVRTVGADLFVERGSSVQVAIDNDDLRRAEDGHKLYPGDRVVTGVGSHARIAFFDGTVLRLSELSDITLERSQQGNDDSELEFFVTQGSAWIKTPSKQTYSGSIVRQGTTAVMELTIPANTEAVIGERSVIAFSTDGIGISADVPDSVIPIIIGEGQKFVLPPGASEVDDFYSFRSALDPLAVQSTFVQESRRSILAQLVDPEDPTTAIPTGVTGEQELIITSPENDVLVESSTVEISGRVGSSIERIRANGYMIELSDDGTFSQDLALPDEELVDIVIVGLAEDGTTVAEARRQVRRDRQPPPPPEITSPATEGQTYRTQSEEFVIQGTTDANTVGISVNDYRLQLYQPGEQAWRYLASTRIDNLQPGRNVYEIRAINNGGYVSEPATIIIMLEPGEEGVIADDSEPEDPENPDAEDTEPEQPDPSTLPTNDPLTPGILGITAPNDGSEYQADGEFLIEGSTSTETYSIWVNDYQLRLYEPGKTFWNYIADPELNTLKPGRNVFRITARNENLEILDQMEYVVRYQAN